MTVTDNGDGTFTVAVTAEERIAFDRAVAAGLIPGKTPAEALHGFLGQAFGTMQNKARQSMLEELRQALPGLSAEKLQTLLGSVKA